LNQLVTEIAVSNWYDYTVIAGWCDSWAV